MSAIKTIFERDINRNINGVVKVNQDKADVVYQELDEYVVTNELNRHIRRFFDCYQQSFMEKTDKVGVWVSGFFGSGKSHFLKILGYVLQDFQAEAPDGSTRNAIDFFRDKIADPSLMAAIEGAAHSNTDVILFNIDSKADSSGDDKDSILNVFMRVFNEMQGFSAEIPELAEMERFLTEKGQYEQFRTLVEQKADETWEEYRDSFRLDPETALEAFAEVRGTDLKNAEKWFEDAEEKYSLSIEKFSKLIREYLDRKGNGHRIIFLVDEIGQYIGDNTSLMLNLQTITENLGTTCEGRAWVVVTSQEDIDAIIGDLKASKANDFSKIQGRFNTRLSLSSSNTDEVIKKRILAKNDGIQNDLGSLWDANKDILRNQLSFSADNPTLKFYSDRQDFVDTYPFATYQFDLLQKVFESIRKAGATGKHLAQGERSMLDSFQIAAQKVQQDTIGVLVPFFEFYDAIEGFLDSIVVRSINKARELDTLIDFDDQLIKTLFLIRYVDLVKPNVENLVTLCVSKVDDDRIVLKREVEESLARLEKENLISSNGDLYSFLTNEEQAISREIKSVRVSQHEVNNLMSEILIREVLQDKKKHRYNRNKKDYNFSFVIDNAPYGHAKETIGIEIISPLYEEYDIWGTIQGIANTAEGSNRIIYRLANADGSLNDELSRYLQTDRYVKQKNSPTNSENIKSILNNRGTENRNRRRRIAAMLETMFLGSDVYSVGKTFEDKNASSPIDLLSSSLDYLIDNTYKKLTFLQTYCNNLEDQLRGIFSGTAPELILDADSPEVHSNYQAFKELENDFHLRLDEYSQVTIKEITEKFNGYPYGWPQEDTVALIAFLFRHRRIRLMYKQNELDFKNATEILRKSRNWGEVCLRKEEKVSEKDRKKVVDLVKKCFDEVPPSDVEKLVDHLERKLADTTKELEKWKHEASSMKYPTCERVHHYHAIFNQLAHKSTASAAKFIEAVAKAEDDLLDFEEDYPNLESFHKTQKEIWNTARRFKSDKEQNSSYYSGTTKEAWDDLDEILNNKNPYGKINQLKGLLDDLSKADDDVVEDSRQEQLAVLDTLVDKVKNQSDDQKLTADERNHALYRLQQLKKGIETAVAIDTLIAKTTQAETEYDRSLAYIQKVVDDRNKVPSGPGEPPKPKPVRPVIAKNSCKKIYLETEDDVESFVDSLREDLIREIKAGNRVQIK